MSILERFRQLAIDDGLKKGSETYKSRRREFVAAEVRDGFIAQFGTNASSLQAWKNLCVTIGIDNVGSFTSISQCKEALDGVYVNLVDLVDAAQAGSTLEKTFPSAKALSRYIKRTKKVFPKERAKKVPLLRQFLIVVN